MDKICASKMCDQQSWCLKSGLKQSRFLDKKGDQIRKGALKKVGMRECSNSFE